MVTKQYTHIVTQNRTEQNKTIQNKKNHVDYNSIAYLQNQEQDINMEDQ